MEKPILIETDGETTAAIHSPEEIPTYSLYIITPRAFEGLRSMDDLAEGLQHAFLELGMTVPIVRQPSQIIGRPIVLRSNLLGKLSVVGLDCIQLPENAILLNLEQVVNDGDSTWMNEEYIAALRKHTVWDYSELNAERLKDLGVPPILAPILHPHV